MKIHRETDCQLSPEQYAHLRATSPGLCRRILERLQLPAGGILCDVGCGPGLHTVVLAEMYRGSVIGIDKDAARILHAKAGLSSCTWKVADSVDLPLASKSIDGLTVMFAFHRFSQPHKALYEFARVLRSGSRLAIVTLSHQQLKSRPELNGFPEALLAELARFPRINQIETILMDVGYSDIQTEQYKEVVSYSGYSFLEWVRMRPYSSHRFMPKRRFCECMKRLSDQFSTLPQVEIANEATIITAEHAG
ncbi:Demethylrebeccamycin-D-glucose O-methyltransferase [Anaerohalosphaera lusitana]|uniref:Demethylrebeccamycin-D-glucose O-methyltransferase n=1 Tax=Anaerohalosphaera lusitana TaxID=1936003 RepID=A0A1U9NK66_9BACT|nr:methyltransferase domain-containing protein [Anaerohalosphaera lusitana]AQT67906.1 Demethylrebeccamycin-D-glucose O-methyltransferase [Anaerohalosphaera lusitana]